MPVGITFCHLRMERFGTHFDQTINVSKLFIQNNKSAYNIKHEGGLRLCVETQKYLPAKDKKSRT